tara:strand:+ start:86 stop:268 length:183 start_codon:yes stop_codon:yes gene_type:complete
LKKHQGKDEKTDLSAIPAMPGNEYSSLDLAKNRIDDHLNYPYENKHREIDRKSMFMAKLQ